MSFLRIGGRCCAPEVAARINSMPRAKGRITWSWVKIVMNVPPRVNGRRAVAPRNDQDLARPVLLPVPPQRSLLQHEHIIARWLTQSAPSRKAIWLNPPALVRLPAEPGLRLAPGAKF